MGMFSREREPCGKTCCLASLTDAALQLVLCISKQKRTSRFMWTDCNVRVSGLSVGAFHVSGTSGMIFLKLDAARSQQRKTCDVVSHPRFSVKEEKSICHDLKFTCVTSVSISTSDTGQLPPIS